MSIDNKLFIIKIFSDTNNIYIRRNKISDYSKILLSEIFVNICWGPTAISIIKRNIYHQGINDFEIGKRFFLITASKKEAPYE